MLKKSNKILRTKLVMPTNDHEIVQNLTKKIDICTVKQTREMLWYSVK
jgi:hypothetical protein